MSMLVHSLPMKGKNRLDCDVIYTAAKHTSLVHVTATIIMAVFTAFFYFFLFQPLDLDF